MSEKMSEKSEKTRVEIYDTTLRDGAQGRGISFSLRDKLKIARHLDTLGVDFIEGGYPLSNPKDEAFFAEAPSLGLKHAKICAFGMTRKKKTRPEKDPGMAALVNSGAPVITIVGKTSDLQVEKVLNVTLNQNLAMIGDSVSYCNTTPGPSGSCAQVFYDAEHFFDGYKANPTYALSTLRAAADAGATHLILCDTNGGTLPGRVADVVTDLRDEFGDDVTLGIHAHNDAGLAVANSLEAVEKGCTHVQGTINGLGERCGNADLITVAANLQRKMVGFDCLEGSESLKHLTETSRFVYELANMNLPDSQPYVGPGAFAHKGGMHVHAVSKLAGSYEHIPPEDVGNTRRVLVSELSGVSNISAALGKKFDVADDKKLQRRVLEKVQSLENAGYQFETANASFELLLRSELNQRKDFWKLDHYRCVILKNGEQEPTTEATVKLRINDHFEHYVAEGDGPVNALNGALRKCLTPYYPQLANVHLRDYKVRVVNATEETAAKVRVVTDFSVLNPDAADKYFSTIGVSENIVEASWQSLIDAFEYHLLECDAKNAN